MKILCNVTLMLDADFKDNKLYDIEVIAVCKNEDGKHYLPAHDYLELKDAILDYQQELLEETCLEKAVKERDYAEEVLKGI